MQSPLRGVNLGGWFSPLDAIGWSCWNYKNPDFGLASRGEARFVAYPQDANDDRTDHELMRLLTSH